MKARIICLHIVSQSSLQNSWVEDKVNISATGCGY
jgi:hypothetical protein